MQQNITIVGHRGAKGEAPENTLPAFERAGQLGLAEVELDVRLSCDDELVVLHDKNMQRTTGQPGNYLSYSANELEKLDARGPFPGWPDRAGIPRLADVFRISSPRLRYQLEVKGASMAMLDRLAEKLLLLLDEHEMNQQVVVTSKYVKFLKKLARLRPWLARGYVGKYQFQQPIRRTRDADAGWLILNARLANPAFVAKAHKQGLQLSVWTVNDLALAERLVSYGITSLITDYPSAFHRHFNGS